MKQLNKLQSKFACVIPVSVSILRWTRRSSVTNYIHLIALKPIHRI